MNAKILFAATVAVSALSLVGSVAMAADADSGVTRAEVKSRLAGTGNVSRGELYEVQPLQTVAMSPVRRSEVIAALAAQRTLHPYDNIGERNAESAPDAYAAPSALARAEVKADVRHAMADGTLQRSGEGDIDGYAANAAPRRAARQHLALASR